MEIQFDFSKDRITAQCATCGRVRRIISGWGEVIELSPKFAKIFCPDCSPKPSEKINSKIAKAPAL